MDLLGIPKNSVWWKVYIPFLSCLHLFLEVSDEQIPGMQYNGIGFCNGQQPITVDVSGIPMQHLNNFFQPSQESLSWTIVFKWQASHMPVKKVTEYNPTQAITQASDKMCIRKKGHSASQRLRGRWESHVFCIATNFPGNPRITVYLCFIRIIRIAKQLCHSPGREQMSREINNLVKDVICCPKRQLHKTLWLTLIISN